MECEMNEIFTIRAQVIQVMNCHLCVCDLSTRQTILVNWPCSCHFRVGDYVCIEYDGMMTRSQPPQITASNVYCMHNH